MAKKKATKKTATKKAAQAEPEVEASSEPMRKMRPSAESLISDGVVFNKSLSHMAKFAKNTVRRPSNGCLRDRLAAV